MNYMVMSRYSVSAEIVYVLYCLVVLPCCTALLYCLVVLPLGPFCHGAS